MLALLSPAKTLDYDSELPPHDVTAPRLEAKTGRLVSAASNLTKDRIGEIMKISDKLADLNYRRYRHFDDQPERAAIYAFAGDVYNGFEAKSLEPEAIAFAQDHVRILSGLYGLLRPLDAIRPYRLEMGTRWAPRYDKLTDFWGKTIADLLADDLDAEGSGTIINLASNEYYAAVEGSRTVRAARVIAIDFREDGPKGLRFNSFAAKQARGVMARYICEHRLEKPEELKGFDSDGYRYVEDGSEEHSWRFVRAAA
ncbi:peroxide stress protein YaaA [Novosphingopyxis sp. YJ-S2-01]|uniref:peroxide stress protein YaaA n=1 Tax=Novosphingopyxis sp. YJ-S2-01 TaxID=2794021 RepID=UPI0018DE5E97|nr:peroxide stress protein YaaA [Novosphingopyxis sp. YJ-S2-01]MBH9537969.1 peroxide stress protein YaaA [Novosphingopyxis sp. YJ-S2-01]